MIPFVSTGSLQLTSTIGCEGNTSLALTERGAEGAVNKQTSHLSHMTPHMIPLYESHDTIVKSYLMAGW